MKTENPFYSNYVFSSVDLHRARIRWWAYPLLWLRPTYVQIGEGYAFHFKQDGTGRIFLMKVEELPSNAELTRTR